MTNPPVHTRDLAVRKNHARPRGIEEPGNVGLHLIWSVCGHALLKALLDSQRIFFLDVLVVVATNGHGHIPWTHFRENRSPKGEGGIHPDSPETTKDSFINSGVNAVHSELPPQSRPAPR
jgi:hypothetical protein